MVHDWAWIQIIPDQIHDEDDGDLDDPDDHWKYAQEKRGMVIIIMNIAILEITWW